MDVRKHPINKDATRLLLAAKQTPDPELIPALQLAMWGATHGLDVPAELVDQVEALLYSEQKWAMPWVLGKIPGEPVSAISYLRNETEPLTGAWKVIDRIKDVRMTRS